MSNAFDKASLVMLPHAYEEGKVYSLKPTDRSGDFTYSRGTDTATRVGEDGYIKKEYGNVLEQSNTFSDAIWTKANGATITGGQSGYDGTSNAWLFTADAGVGYLVQLSTAGIQTFSIYAKQNTLSHLVALPVGGSAATTYFDLSTGNVGTQGLGALDAKMVDAGGGWWRCSITSLNQSQYRMYLSDSDGAYTGGTGSIYIQDAMLNQGLVAYPYLETTTAPVYGGLTDDMPRLDYSGGATCPSLLLEPSRTNLITHSEFYTYDGGWRLIGLTPEYGYGISPEGLKNSVKISQSSNSSARIESVSALSLSAGVNYTFSFFVKNIDAAITLISGTSGSSYEINWSGAEISSVTTGLKYKDFGNGWYRVWETSASSGSTIYRIYPDRISPYTGSIEIYGTQAEDDGAGGGSSYPTSYIPTYGSSQTRAVDDMDLNPSTAWDTTGAWTMFIEMERIQSGLNYDDIIVLSGINTLRFRDRPNSGIMQVMLNNVAPTSGVTAPIGERIKIVIKNDGNVMKWFGNGEEKQFIDNTILVNNITSFSINKNHIKHQEVYFPTALSDSECIALTTL